MSVRREIYEAHFRHYQKAGENGEENILDEAAETTGLNQAYGETLFHTSMC
jgi:hypothetical protein